MDERVQKYEQKMTKTLKGFEEELTTIRAGRANPHILDKITVDYYGSPTPIQQVANITVPEARMIQIQPWESSLIKGIEKAILTSDLGLNPNNDGKLIRLVLPELTEERRKELVKDVKKKGEAAKVAVRNVRRDANDAFKKLAKQDVSEDEIKDLEDAVQKLRSVHQEDRCCSRYQSKRNSDCIIPVRTERRGRAGKRLSFCCIKFTREKEENLMKVPNHIAIILDGNGRWAKAKGMPRGYGHIKGCANLETICDDIKDLGVKYLTVYAFSTENWKRSREEVEGLMKLFRSYLKKCMKSAEKNHMRVKIIGDPSAFAPDIQDKIRQLEEFSKDYDELYFQIALNYGSRDEIVRSIRKLAADVADGKVAPDAIDESCFENYLDTAGVPDPDLLIRTSGEQRLSNFLMWQLAYTEFYFTDVPWPDFHKKELIEAIEKYNARDRRYGGVKEE